MTSAKRKIELAELVNEPWVLPPPRSVVASLTLKAFAPVGSIIPAQL